MKKIVQLIAYLIVINISSLMGMKQIPETPQEKDQRIISQLRLVNAPALDEFTRVCRLNTIGEGKQAILSWSIIRKDLDNIRRKIIERQIALDYELFAYSFHDAVFFGLVTMVGMLNNEQFSSAQNVVMGITLLSAINNLVNTRDSKRTFDGLQNLDRQANINQVVIDYAHANPDIKYDSLLELVRKKMGLSYKEYDDLSKVLLESKNKHGYFDVRKYLDYAPNKFFHNFFSDPREQRKYSAAYVLNSIVLIGIASLFLDTSGMLLVPVVTNIFTNIPLGIRIFSYGKDRELKKGLDEIIYVIDTHTEN